jgi:CRISPR-associated protein Csm2
MAQHGSQQYRGIPPARPFQGGGGARPPQPAARLDVSRIVFATIIDPRLYSDIAEEAAKGVAQGAGRDRNKPSQLRRFYDELLSLQERVGRDQSRFEEHRPFIQMLKAKVAYAQGRGKVDENFSVLLGRVVDQAQDAAAFKQARLFMEAFMAFYKVHGPRD